MSLNHSVINKINISILIDIALVRAVGEEYSVKLCGIKGIDNAVTVEVSFGGLCFGHSYLVCRGRNNKCYIVYILNAVLVDVINSCFSEHCRYGNIGCRHSEGVTVYRNPVAVFVGNSIVSQSHTRFGRGGKRYGFVLCGCSFVCLCRTVCAVCNSDIVGLCRKVTVLNLSH